MLKDTLSLNDFLDAAESHFHGAVGGTLMPHVIHVERERRITVNKTTHRIRFENETESSVDVVIEPKEQP